MTAQYGLWQFGERRLDLDQDRRIPNKDLPVGGAAVIQLGPDEFLVAGSDVRLRFSLAKPAAGEQLAISSTSRKAHSQNGQWIMTRRWNGDQIDYGLNLAKPVLLKVRLGTYR